MSESSASEESFSILDVGNGSHPARSSQCGICLQDIRPDDACLFHSRTILGGAACLNSWHAHCLATYSDQFGDNDLFRCPTCRAPLRNTPNLRKMEELTQFGIEMRAFFDEQDESNSVRTLEERIVVLERQVAVLESIDREFQRLVRAVEEEHGINIADYLDASQAALLRQSLPG